MREPERELLSIAKDVRRSLARIADALDPPHDRDAKVIDGERLEVLLTALGKEVLHIEEEGERIPEATRVLAIELDTLVQGLVSEGGRLVVERPPRERLGRDDPRWTG